MPRLPILIAMLPLLGCAAGVPAPTASLPESEYLGAGDPTRAAILGSSYAFALPANLAARPDAAAQAAAQVEYLATEIPVGPRWTQFSPVVGLELQAARTELRQALAIAPQAPPQSVVDGLYGASRALAAGDANAAARALPAATFTDRGTTLARLFDLPPLPRTRVATALLKRELYRVDQEGNAQGGGGDADGRGD